MVKKQHSQKKREEKNSVRSFRTIPVKRKINEDEKQVSKAEQVQRRTKQCVPLGIFVLLE